MPRRARAAAVVASAFLALAAGHAFGVWPHLAGHLRVGPVLFCEDGVVALAFGVLALAIGRFAWVTVALGLVWTILNVGVTRSAGSPLTVPMLRAADPAMGDSIRSQLTLGNLAAMGTTAAIALIAVRLSTRSVAARRVGLALAAGCSCLWMLSPPPTLQAQASIGVLIRSAVPRIVGSPSVREFDWREERHDPNVDPAVLGLKGAATGRNVVLVVLESCASRYVSAFGGGDDLMPFLGELGQESLVVPACYAVYPESIKGLLALQHSVHPAVDSRPEDYVEMPAPALGSVLRQAGYTTALFHSGRFRFLGMDHVIGMGGYDVRRDAGSISGDQESSFGVAESATVDAALAWVDRTTKPFFLCYMPVVGHHPYDTPSPGPWPENTAFDAYRNALWHADRAVARLVDGLRSGGCWRNTVFVVVGDHGQAFGQHPGNYGHTLQLFEENVRVPFLAAVPGVSSGMCDPRPMSHVDVAPTIAALLGLAIPSAWEGRSFLARTRRDVLMFTDYAQALLGVRAGSEKVIHDVQSGRTSLFDLSVDPEEQNDLAPQRPTRARELAGRVQAWARDRRSQVDRWISSEHR